MAVSINDPLPNGAPRNPLGRGGEVAHEARLARPDALARLRALLLDASPLNAAAALEAAELALDGADRALKVAAVHRLHKLVLDPKVPVNVSAKAAGLILALCGRQRATAARS